MNVQKKFKFQQFSLYGEYTMDIPVGYEFLQFVESNGQSYAVLIETLPLKEALKDIENEYLERSKRDREANEKILNEKIKTLGINKVFSDLITNFKIGDSAWYYSQYVSGYNADNDILEDHIKRFTIDSIILEKGQIKAKKLESDEDDYYWNLIVHGWNERAHYSELYKTKEEAIEGSKERHAKMLQEKELAKKNAEKLAIEKKKKEEEEILRKAEEIRKSK